jgi:hypothetical protein
MRQFKRLRYRNACGRNCSAEYDFEFGCFFLPYAVGCDNSFGNDHMQQADENDPPRDSVDRHDPDLKRNVGRKPVGT